MRSKHYSRPTLCTIAVFHASESCYCRCAVRLKSGIWGRTHDVLVLARFPVCFGGPFQTCGVLRRDDPAGEDNGESASMDIARLPLELVLPPPLGCKVIFGGAPVLFFAPGPREGRDSPFAELRI